MRWKTYHQLVEQFERYEAVLDSGGLVQAVKLIKRG
jgi:hypothetical protein